MLNYWDLEEPDRAKLTAQQLEEFVAAECMQKGVLRAKPLELVTVPEMPEPDVSVYTLKLGYHAELAFASAELAQEVLARVYAMVEGAWINSQTVPHLKAPGDATVEAKRIYSEEKLAECRQRIEQATAAKSENEKRRAEWEKARSAEGSALQGLYEDWHLCQGKACRMREIAAVYADYCKTAGDPSVAARFLHKVYTHAEISDAVVWCGVAIPEVECDNAPEPKREAAPDGDEIAF